MRALVGSAIFHRERNGAPLPSACRRVLEKCLTPPTLSEMSERRFHNNYQTKNGNSQVLYRRQSSTTWWSSGRCCLPQLNLPLNAAVNAAVRRPSRRIVAWHPVSTRIADHRSPQKPSTARAHRRVTPITVAVNFARVLCNKRSVNSPWERSMSTLENSDPRKTRASEASEEI